MEDDKLVRVIDALEHCELCACNNCPYNENGKGGWNCRQMHKDALELLKEYKRQDRCPCTHCMEWECDEVCEEYKKWKDS